MMGMRDAVEMVVMMIERQRHFGRRRGDFGVRRVLLLLLLLSWQGRQRRGRDLLLLLLLGGQGQGGGERGAAPIVD